LGFASVMNIGLVHGFDAVCEPCEHECAQILAKDTVLQLNRLTTARNPDRGTLVTK